VDFAARDLRRARKKNVNASPLDKFREACARLADNPTDDGLLYGVFEAGQDAALDETVSLFNARLNAPSSALPLRLNEWHIYAILRERQGRRAAGLSTTNATCLSDLNFRYARKELDRLILEANAFLSKRYDAEGAAILLAEAALSTGQVALAERTFSALRKFGSGSCSVANFDPAFHADLDGAAEKMLAALPPVETIRASAGRSKIIMTSADFFFFERFGWQFVESYCRHQDPGAGLHLHIIDMTPEERAAVTRRLDTYVGLTWSMTTEWTGLRGGNPEKARGYYHAVRFARFWRLLVETDAIVWMLDIDTIFGKSASPLFHIVAGHDLALWCMPARCEVRNKICAASTGAANTEAARTYLRRVAGYIGAYWQQDKLRWGIDQVAMYAVLIMSATPPRVAAIPEDVTRDILIPAKGLS
jgi:hypothetical protein